MGKERLAASGFYVHYAYHGSDPVTPDNFSVIYISDNQKCKYATDDWHTLLWTCAPTKKKVANSRLKADINGIYEVYDYFPTHTDLLTSKYFPMIVHKCAGALSHP